MSQAGKPYIWGASAAPSDPNPKAFDCSELTKWAAARVGVNIPDMASAQYIYLRDHGATMSVDQALHTPGALLFRFPHEPTRVGENPNAEHVAISVGDGVHTIEAGPRVRHERLRQCRRTRIQLRRDDPGHELTSPA